MDMSHDFDWRRIESDSQNSKFHENWKSLGGNKEDTLSAVIGDFLGTTLANKKVSSSELSQLCTLEIHAVVDIKIWLLLVIAMKVKNKCIVLNFAKLWR
jgi:hypothetical protein